jgi:hypothetical protein
LLSKGSSRTKASSQLSLCHGRHPIEEEQTTQWPTAKMQKDKQRFIKHAHKTKDRVTRTQLRQGVISGVPEGQTVPDHPFGILKFLPRPIFSGVCVIQGLVVYLVLCRYVFVLLSFFF